MPGQPVKIGPFVGGLNNVSLAGESKDNEVVELVNFDIALDTSLVSRPPIEVIPGTPSNLANQWDVLGVFRVTASNWYAIVNAPTGATTYEVRAYPLGNFSSAPVVIKTTTGLNNRVVSFVQYNDWVYFNVAEGAADTGFRWKIGTIESIAAMPRGSVMVTWEDRIWITGSGTASTGNYVWFSTVDATGPKPNTWNTSTDFFNADPGSGGLNTALLPLTNSLLIFKQDATYRFSFPTAPKNGDLSNVSRQIGAAGPNSVIGFESYCFVYDQGRVYELINTRFTQINLNVDFNNNTAESVDAAAVGVDMSVVARRLLIRYFNTMFVYNVDTRTWSQWVTNSGTPGKFIELPTDSASAAPSTYITASRGVTQNVGLNRILNPSFGNAEINATRSTVPNSTGSVSFTGGIATVTKTGAGNPELILSDVGQLWDYHIPVSPNQQFTMTATVSSTETGTNKFQISWNFLRRDGSTTSITTNILAADIPNLSEVVIVPANAFLMNVSFKTIGAVGSAFTIKDPNLVRSNVASPVSLLRLVDQYQNTTPMEFITCIVKSKSYDYQASSVFKRLFLWGLDVMSTRPIKMSAMPLGRKRSVTHDEMEAYTWDELDQGTFDNPLSWLGETNTIVDMAEDVVEISENNRFFVKAMKSMRFRQIQYQVEMTTLGNKDTGPVKLFSITSYTKAGQLVVDKST